MQIREQVRPENWKHFKSEKTKYKKFIKEKLEENNPKKQKFENEPYECEHNGKDLNTIDGNDKERTQPPEKGNNDTVVTESTRAQTARPHANVHQTNLEEHP